MSSGMRRASCITFPAFCKRSRSEWVSPISELGIKPTTPANTPNNLTQFFIFMAPLLSHESWFEHTNEQLHVMRCATWPKSGYTGACRSPDQQVFLNSPPKPFRLCEVAYNHESPSSSLRPH